MVSHMPDVLPLSSSLLYAIPHKSQALRGKFTKTLSLCSRALLFPKSKNFQRPAWACPARQRCFAPGLRLPASASALGAGLASCWPRPQQLLPVSAAGGGRRCCSQGERLLHIEKLLFLLLYTKSARRIPAGRFWH